MLQAGEMVGFKHSSEDLPLAVSRQSHSYRETVRYSPCAGNPAKRGKGKKTWSLDEEQTPAERRAAMTWAKRLKRVFDIDIETCSECGGDVRIIASIEDPAVIQKILAYLDNNATAAATALFPECRAPPGMGVLSEA